MTKFQEFNISDDEWMYAQDLAMKVFKKRKSNKQKFKNGTEYQADLLGFLSEIVVADNFNCPRPKLETVMPCYDLVINGYRIDVKHSSHNLINEGQYHKNKNVDYYLFCRLKTDWIDYKLKIGDEFQTVKMPCINKDSRLQIAGVIHRDTVIKCPKYTNRENGSSYYVIDEVQLLPATFIISRACGGQHG